MPFRASCPCSRNLPLSDRETPARTSLRADIHEPAQCAPGERGSGLPGTRAAHPQGIGAEVDLPADDSRLELGRGVAPIPVAVEEPRQVREEEDDHAGIGAELLLEAEIAGLAPKSALLQQLKGTVRWREVDGAVREA